MKLVHYGVVFSIRDALFLRWTDLALRLNVSEQVLQIQFDYAINLMMIENHIGFTGFAPSTVSRN